MKNILKLAALVVVAAVGAFVMRALFVAASRPGPAAPAPVEHVRAAAADLPDGLLLRDSDLVWKAVPRAEVPAGALVQSRAGENDLKGDLLRHAVRAGTPLGASDVISPSSPGFLAAALKPGMRAISVAIDDVSGNAGLIQPGDYVDVLLTQQLRSLTGAPVEPQRSVESETVAGRVRVLAVGSAFHRPKDDTAAPNTRARTVTFEVTPKGAQVITVASHLGSLSLALRSFATRERHTAGVEEPAETLTAPVWAGDVSRGLRSAEPSAPAAAMSGRGRGTPVHAPAEPRPVIVYRGSKQGEAGSSTAPGLPAGLPPLPSGMPPVAPAATGATTQPAA